jgi:serine/threonine protein kinase
LNAAAASSKPPGTVVGGYTLHAEVGRGGMGSVYKATAPDGSTVAVKLLASHLNDNPILLKRFQQEARLAKRITHPNLVRAIELGEQDGEHFFAMEFVEGESVGSKVRRARRFTENEAVKTCIAVAEALAAAHAQGLIHRDVKPDNIMVTRSGQVKLADMGLAKDTVGEDLNLTKTGRGLGTPHFMAPEQFKEAKTVDVRCDIYSLGATLYMMVTGQLPFRANNPLDAFIKKSQNEYEPPEKVVPDLSSKVVKAIKHSMEADPKKRPQTMAEFAAELKSALGSSRAGDVWYVVYKDADGERKKVKGAQQLVAAMIRNRKLGRDATGCRDKNGEFLPLENYPEFAALFPVEAPLESVENGKHEAVETPPPAEAVSEAPSLADGPPSAIVEPSAGSRFESLNAPDLGFLEEKAGLTDARSAGQSTSRVKVESDRFDSLLSSSRSTPPEAEASFTSPESSAPLFVVTPFLATLGAVVIALLIIAAFFAGRMSV